MSDSPELEPNNDQLTYQEFVSCIEIDNINIKRLTMESVVAPQDVPVLLDKGQQIEIELDHKFSLLKKSEDIALFKAIGFVQASARIGESVLFLIDIELIAEYDISKLEKFIPDQLYEDFVQNNVPVNLWPYAREAIQSGTTKMGYPPLIIRPYRVIL